MCRMYTTTGMNNDFVNECRWNRILRFHFLIAYDKMEIVVDIYDCYNNQLEELWSF